MHIEIVTLCHSAVVRDGQLSILAAFNAILVEGFPHNYPPLTLACRLRFDEEEAGPHVMKANIADMDGHVLAQMLVSLDLSHESFDPFPFVTMHLIFPIAGMRLRASGEHTIDLLLDDGSASSTSFYVASQCTR